MARFFPFMAKKYNPYYIDQHMFAMHVHAVRSIPVVCSSMIGEYGTATVNGIKIGSGKCYKFDFSPFPILLLPVGEVANDFYKVYTVKLEGYRNDKGSKFRTCTFKVRTAAKLVEDGNYAANEQVAKNVSDEGIVLLENYGVLPLKEHTQIALLGEFQNFRISAIGASFIKPRWTYTVPEAIEHTSLKVSDQAETALFFISRASGENKDNRPIKGEYYLTDREKQDLNEAVQQYKNVILVLNTGYPIEMRFIRSLPISAMIWTGFCGQRGVESLFDILLGKVNPSGKLADTWSFDYYDSPSSLNFINQDENAPVYTDNGKKHGASVVYAEGPFIGYRYFDTFSKQVAYSFGHGLSYTMFKMECSAEWVNKTLNIRVNVQNIGKRIGKQTVFAFIQCPEGLRKPKRVLVGFEKTKHLSENESQELFLSIPAKDFSVFDDKTHSFILEKGEYILCMGESLQSVKKIYSFTVNEKIVIEKSISVCAPTEALRLIDNEGNVLPQSKKTTGKGCIAKHAEYILPERKELHKYKGKKITFSAVKADSSKLDNFISQMSIKELVNFTVCNGSCWKPWQSGAAGKLARCRRLGIPRFYMSDGNCSVNLNVNTTGFPSSNLLASTFNKELAYNVGKVLADESKEHGIAINLGPGANLHRNILCGRHPEYFSEDPIVSGTLMAYQARGLEENGTISTYKHLFANGMEWERLSAHSIIDKRTVRELYLRVFDKAFSLYKPGCVMTSYNPVNGIYPCENAVLLNELLRDEWGFEGFVMTDWGSYDTADCIKSVNAGTSLLTPGDKKRYKHILKAVKNGAISKATLQYNVKQIMKVLIKC